MALYATADEGVREIVISKTKAKTVLGETKSVKNVTSRILTQMEVKQRQHVEHTVQVETTLHENVSNILHKLSNQQNDATLLLAESVTTRDSISKWDERFQDQLAMASTYFTTWKLETNQQLAVWSTSYN